MTQQEKQTWFTKFNNQLHILGRITLGIGVILMLAAPFVIGVLLDAAPNMNGFLKGIARVAVIYVPVGIVEFLVYAPMLGAGGSYLSFITGNVTNLKIPCAMNARDIAKTEVGTPENEIISTLSVATSSLVTMLVLFVGVLLLVPLRPILENPVLTPAFDTVVPALFGALGLKYFSKAPKIAIVPLAAMTLLCVLVPAAIPQTSILLIPAGGLALGIGYLLYKKGRI